MNRRIPNGMYGGVRVGLFNYWGFVADIHGSACYSFYCFQIHFYKLFIIPECYNSVSIAFIANFKVDGCNVLPNIWV